MKHLLEQIEQTTPKLSDWCSIEKAHLLACIILGLKPRVVVEIGVWQGASAIPMALALKYNKSGCLYAIDPWSKEASIESQKTEADKVWWASVDHEKAYNNFLFYIHQTEVQDIVKPIRMKSSEFTPPDVIDMLHIDGRHDDGAMDDVLLYAPHIGVGGIVVMDDLDWMGGGVRKAERELLGMGFEMLYPLGSGAVYRRISHVASVIEND